MTCQTSSKEASAGESEWILSLLYQYYTTFSKKVNPPYEKTLDKFRNMSYHSITLHYQPEKKTNAQIRPETAKAVGASSAPLAP